VLTCAAVVAGLAMITACGSSPDADAAAQVSQSFHRAVSAGEGQAACEVLAPGVVDELEESAGTPCEQAIVDEGLPAAETILESAAFGTGAMVVLDGDVVFLAEFDGGWRVTAAGCTPRADRPYDCLLQGG
jgi:hypothetical protein